LWDFGNNNTSTDQDPIEFLVYQESYNIILTAANDVECVDTSNMILNIKDFPDYVDLGRSNIFTPNGDGLNEEFELSRFEQQINQCGVLRIFNRWGNMIFHSEYSGAGWNGKNFSGIDVPVGTYYYILEIKDFKYNGSITLYR